MYKGAFNLNSPEFHKLESRHSFSTNTTLVTVFRHLDLHKIREHNIQPHCVDLLYFSGLSPAKFAINTLNLDRLKLILLHVFTSLLKYQNYEGGQ